MKNLLDQFGEGDVYVGMAKDRCGRKSREKDREEDRQDKERERWMRR